MAATKVKLVLKGRFDKQWHDYYPLINALSVIAKGKSYSKGALWFDIARRVEEAYVEADDFDETFPDLIVMFTPKMADLLFTELARIKSESFGRNTRTGELATPNPGRLGAMMRDFAKQLGRKSLVDADYEDDVDE